MATVNPEQLWPEDKIQFSPFSYAKAIIKDEVTYPIVPNCPIINVDNPGTFSASNIPVGTFFIMHLPYYQLPGDWWWMEQLYLRIPDEANDDADGGLKFFTKRGYDPDWEK